MNVLYPNEFPMEEVRETYAILRDGELSGRKAELVKNLWVIVGYGLGQGIGDPDVKAGLPREIDPLTYTLEAAIKDFLVEQETVGSLPEKFSPLIVLIVELAIKKLIEFLSKR
jgi:hypothetical protein